MKNCVGFDIGNHALHIAVSKHGNIVQGLSVRLPEDLVKGGAVTSIEAMIDFLKDVRKKYRLGTRNSGLVLPASLCYCRRFSVAAMTRDQLMFNLPYGFRDFITDDKSNYFFDCAIISAVRYGDGKPPEFDVVAAAVRKEVVEDYTGMFKKAGFRLKTVIPEELSFVNLLRRCKHPHRHGVLDIGHNTVKLFLFNGSVIESVRVMDYGCNALDEVIAEQFGVDTYMAGTYRENNTNGCNELEGCRAVYSAISIEVLKAVNFYRFNGGGTLDHLHCCGGGSNNPVLLETLKNTLPIPLADMSEFFGSGKKKKIPYPLIAAAAGVTMQ